MSWVEHDLVAVCVALLFSALVALIWQVLLLRRQATEWCPFAIAFCLPLGVLAIANLLPC